MESIATRVDKMEAQKDESFSKFMAKSETKLLVSLIPAAENPDVMQTLLRACYDHAYGSGEGAVALMMIESMFKDRKRDDFRP